MELKLKRLDPSQPRPAFSCGNDDLDEFYHVDSIESGKQLMSVTYALFGEDAVVAFFSVSNDSVRKDDAPRSAWDRIKRVIPSTKRHSTLPATKLGRLGVSKEHQRHDLGTEVIGFLKYWFVEGNKTGCRFLLVDAYNKPDVIRFYEKNGFIFFTGTDTDEKTRIMYFDLMPIANTAARLSQ